MAATGQTKLRKFLLAPKIASNLAPKPWCGAATGTPRTGGCCRYETQEATERAVAPGEPRGERASAFARCLRIASTTSWSIMNAIILISPPHDGHTNGQDDSPCLPQRGGTSEHALMLVKGQGLVRRTTSVPVDSGMAAPSLRHSRQPTPDPESAPNLGD